MLDLSFFSTSEFFFCLLIFLTAYILSQLENIASGKKSLLKILIFDAIEFLVLYYVGTKIFHVQHLALQASVVTFIVLNFMSFFFRTMSR